MWRGALLLLLCLLTFLLGLGRTAIVDSDEAYYAAAGREMVADGDWITPHYNFDTRLNKPILIYWLIAGTFKSIGVTEAAARFWPALSGIGLAFLAYTLGRRWVDARTGLLAGVIVASSTGVVLLARQALPDAPLALFISLAIWAAFEAVSTRVAERVSGTTRASRRTWLMLAAISMGLGMLAKGPLALALPAMAIGPLLAWEWWTGRNRGWSFPLRAGDLVLATVLFLLVATPWYAAATHANGSGFLTGFFVTENLSRFATENFNQRREPWFYPGVMAGGLLPWTAFGLFWLKPLREILTRRRSISPIAARLGAWAIGPMLLLSASAGSQPRYILPCLVPVAILLARSILERATSSRRDRLFTGAAVLAGVTLVLFGVLILRAKSLLVLINPEWSPIGAFVIVACGAAVLATTLFGTHRYVPGVVAAGSAATVIAFSATVLTAPRPEPVEIIASEIRQLEPASAICACGAFAKNLTFYTRTPVVVGENEDDLRAFLERPERVLAVTDAKRLAAVERALQRQFPRLKQVSYLNPADWQRPGAALLDPNPDLYLKQIILVANR